MRSTGDRISMNYQGPDRGYTLELRQRPFNGTYGPATSLTATSANNYTVSAPATQVTCFQLVARDACGVAPPRLSTEACSILPPTVTPQPGANPVGWDVYQGGGGFVWYRVHRSIGAPQLIAPTIGGSSQKANTQHLDNANIRCEQYCYHIQARTANTTGETRVYSDNTCVTGQDNSTVAAPTSAFVSVNSSGGIDVVSSLSSTAPSPYTLVVERANAFAGPFNSLTALSNSTNHSDPTAQINSQSYCYRTAVMNKCKVQSVFTRPACSVFLTVLPDGTLEWTKDSPFSNGPPVRFEVFPIDANTGSTLNPSPVNGGTYQFKTDPTQNQSTRYYVAAFNAPGDQSYSNTIDVRLAPQFYIPTAFTPNNDADNPTFKVDGYFLNGFELTLYDRWGNIIFTSTDQKVGWDGTINGQPAPQGAYTYRVKVLDAKEQPFEKAGRVLLLR